MKPPPNLPEGRRKIDSQSLFNQHKKGVKQPTKHDAKGWLTPFLSSFGINI